MTTPQPLVVHTTPIGRDILAAIDGADTIEITPEQSRQDLLAVTARAAALINPGNLRIDVDLLDNAPSLRIIANASRGFDNLPLDDLARRGIWATNVPDAFTASTAEVAIGLMLMVMRRMSEAAAYVHRGAWDRFVPGDWDGHSLVGKTLGIIGYGLIGKATARRARAFDMRVIHTQRRTLTDADCPWVTLDELLATSDIVSLHTPLDASTHHIMNRERLAKMKPGAILINTARGKTVDEAALIDALASGHLGGAGLDVTEFEPNVAEALYIRENVVITPHLGGGTLEARRAAQEHAVANVAAVLRGEAPVMPLNAPIGNPIE